MSANGSRTLEGTAELVEALRALGKSTGKNVLRRIGRRRLEPMRDAAKARVRQRSGNLHDAIIVGTVLARSQRMAKGAGAIAGAGETSKDDVTVYMGPGQQPAAITEEFGKYNQAPYPFMRPAFEEHAEGVIDGIGEDLWGEIAKTAERAARKAARRARGA